MKGSENIVEEKQVTINGCILTTNSEEDHKRAMLFCVFEVLNMDLKKELDLYVKCEKKENRHAEDMPIPK